MAAESHGISEQKRTSPTIGYGSSRPPSHTPDSGKAPAATLTVPRALPPKHQRQPNLVLPEPRPSNGHGHTVLSGRAKPSQRARGSKARCHDGIPAGIGPTASKQHDTPSESVKLQLRLKLTSNTASRRSKHTRIEAEEVRDLSVKWRFTDYSWGGPKCRRLQPKEHQSPLRASPVKAALNPKRKPGSPPWRSVREVTLSIQERGNPLQTSTATSGNTNSGSCDGPSSGTLPPPPSLSTNGGSSNDTTSCPSDELSSERAHPPARPGATIESSAEGRPLDGRLLEHEIVLRLRCVYSDSPHGPSQDLNDDMEVRLGAALHENQLSQWTTRGSPATASALDCYSAHRALIVEVLLVARFHNGQARPQLNNRQFLAGPCARTMEDLSRERNLGRPMFRNIYGEELNSRPMPTDLERFYAYTESIINLHMPAPSRLPETNNRPSMIFEAELEFLQVGPSGQRLASAIKKLHNDLSNDEMDRTRSIQDLYEIGSAHASVSTSLEYDHGCTQ
ncbi:hypothetical protein B0I35DRAFT_86087 [Stachybotrys elegans]|uniref:Uncharacterized protein n=1 Tax=Stachybotrys elegans TaxID=80388 RepID=A0A8K0SJK4_9HYPO|nr:hypothetical protein B0I35DRAFT_86087 [Stachybotrys elegans]